MAKLWTAAVSVAFIVVCIGVLGIVDEAEGSVGTLLSSLVREIFGYRNPASSRRSQRRSSDQYGGCNHKDTMRVHLGLEEMSKYSSCFLQMARHGRIWHPEQEKRTPQIVRDYGYDLVTYDNVTSMDGYITTLFRISGGPGSPPRKGKPAILLFHGFGSSSDQWVLLGKKSPAFLLVNAGFEVWLANCRGSEYSKRHVTLNPRRDLSYWDFSFTEVAVFDLPVYIDLILKETQTKKIFYLGHSLGGTLYSVALSELPQLNDKIHASFLLSPAVFIGHTTSLLRLGSIILDLDPPVINFLNVALRGQFFTGSSINQLVGRFCASNSYSCGFCASGLLGIVGHDPEQYSFAQIPRMLASVPTTVSFKMLLHGLQTYRSCKFRQYDYGEGGNMKKYGSPDPPEFNLWKLRAPMHLYYADSDDFVNPLDMRIFRDSLPPNVVKEFHRVNWTNFNHFEYAMAKDVDNLVYNPIIKSMNKYLK